MNGSPGLIELFPIAMSMLASNLDLLGSVVEIVTSYLFLDARTILAVRLFDDFSMFDMSNENDIRPTGPTSFVPFSKD